MLIMKNPVPERGPTRMPGRVVWRFGATIETALADALARFRDGFDPAFIELPEQAVFPGLIPAQPTTARKARTTGSLLDRPAPRFVKRGRSVRYRFSDVLDWLSDGDSYASTAEVMVAGRAAS